MEKVTIQPIILRKNNAEQLKKATEVLRDKSVVGDFHRSLQIADWMVRYPERFGVSFVVKGA